VKFENWLKYANEISDGVIHSTKYYMNHIDSAIFFNLQQKPLKLGRLIVLCATHPQLYQFLLPWQPTLFQPLWPDFIVLVVLSIGDTVNVHV